MTDRVKDRLAELLAEQEKGKRALAEIDAERAALDAERERLREQLLRIAGAIHILEELSDNPQAPSAQR